MIRKLRYVRGVGFFHDFSWRQGLLDFADLNLIYGWNGSGKSTLSELLRSLETREPIQAGSFQLMVDGGTVGSEDVGSQELVEVRVFNRQFVEENVFTKSQHVAPILLLGKENISRAAEVERLQGEISKVEDGCLEIREQVQKAKAALNGHGTQVASSIKVSIEHGTYRSYDRTKFWKRCEALGGEDVQDYRLQDRDKESLHATLRAAPKGTIEELSVPLRDLTALVVRSQELLSKSVVSATIEHLLGDPELNSWTERGLRLHRSREEGSCLFCGGALPVSRLEELEGHFNREYEELKQGLSSLRGDVGRMEDGLRNVQLPDLGQFYEAHRESYGTARSNYKERIAGTLSYLEDLRGLVGKKEANPFQVIPIPGLEVDSLVAAVEAVDGVIRENNLLTGKLGTGKRDAARRLECDVVARSLPEWKRLRHEKQQAEERLISAQVLEKSLKKKLAKLEKETVRHGYPAKLLNTDLRAYLGREDITFEVWERGYRIYRRGEPASKLSEGEQTAIALLYFLRTLEDERLNQGRCTVVLDDPVSSLDQAALFGAFSFIQQRTRDARQLIILTHSYPLFRLVRNWFGHVKRKSDGKKARMYSLRCVEQEGLRTGVLCPLSKALEIYHSEYHYLFEVVYRIATSEEKDAVDYYGAPNVARRLLEGFYSFRRPGGRRGLYNKLDQSEFPEEKKVRIRRFLDTHSHGESFDAFADQDVSILSETRGVLQDVLALVQSEDGDHYEEMVKVVSAA